MASLPDTTLIYFTYTSNAFRPDIQRDTVSIFAGSGPFEQWVRRYQLASGFQCMIVASCTAFGRLKSEVRAQWFRPKETLRGSRLERNSKKSRTRCCFQHACNGAHKTNITLRSVFETRLLSFLLNSTAALHFLNRQSIFLESLYCLT